MVEHLSIFLDESGDLGFDWQKNGTSKYFIVTVLVCSGLQTTQSVKRAINRTLKNKVNKKPEKRRIVQELKGTGTSLSIKQYFIKQMPEDGWQLYSVVLNKKEVFEHLKSKSGKRKLYNFMSKFLIEQILIPKTTKTINLVLDKCKNTEEIKDFNFYLQTQLESALPHLDVRLDISHESSQDNHGLQAVDLFCWGIARKYHHEDLEWYLLYKEKIAFETVYLNKKRRSL